LGHYEAMLSRYGISVGLRHARKHLGWYMDQVTADAGDSSLRKSILTESDPTRVKALLRVWCGSGETRRAA
jgi:tRNA-dihydrouridine synthase